LRKVLVVLEEKISGIIDHLKSELSSVRTGRAHATLVEDLSVEAYGQKMTLKELASISVPDPNLIMVEPWDRSVLGDIERAIRGSRELGLNPAADENVIRVPVPPLTEERRTELTKLVGQKVEEARQRVRAARNEAVDELRRSEKEGEISEDEKFRREKEIQQRVDDVNREIEEIGKRKEEEIMRI
jgi:ribosome recycling factor